MDLEIEPIRFSSPSEFQERPKYRRDLHCESSEIKGIIGSYEFGKHDFIACQLNGCHVKHGKGYVLVTHNGLETNCGHECGKNEFGFPFEEFEKQYWERVRRRDARKVITDFKTEIPQYRQRCSNYEDEFKVLAGFVGRFVSILGEDEATFRLIRYADGGKVVHSKKITGKMRKWRTFRSDQMYISEDIGVIQGHDAIVKSTNIQSKWNELFSLMDKLEDIDPAAIKDHEIPGYAHDIKLFREDLSEIGDFISSARAFKSPANQVLMEKIRPVVNSASHSVKASVFDRIEQLFKSSGHSD